MIYDRFIFPLLQRPFWKQVHTKRAQWKLVRENELIVPVSSRSSIKIYRDDLLSPHIYDHSFEWAEREWLLSWLQPHDIMYDVGANIGYLSLLAAEKCSNVISFEPVHATAKKFRENLSLNPHLKNISLHEIALSDRNGEQDIFLSTEGRAAWNSMVSGLLGETKTEKQKTTTITLDEFIIGHNRPRPSLIKIDVEGWEKNVIEGGKEVLKKMKPLLLVEFTKTNLVSTGSSMKELNDLICSYGYRTFYYEPRKRSLLPFSSFDLEHLNVIAVPA